MGKLDGKVSIITGGSGGIGGAAARLFAAEGSRVMLNPGTAVDTPGFATPEEKRVVTASGRLHMMDPDQMRAPVVWLVSNATDTINGMRYDAVSWDAARPAAEQAALHGRPMDLELKLKLKPEGDGGEVRDDRPTTGTQTEYRPRP